MSKLCKVPFCENLESPRHTYCGFHRWEREKYKIKAYKEFLPYWCLKRCNIHGYLNYHQVYVNKANNQKICRLCGFDHPYYSPEKRRKYHIKTRNQRKDSKLKKDYGINLKEYEEILLKQKSKCAICSIHILEYQSKKSRIINFVVDHCHKTNKVRGLLCHKCNMGLGYFSDNPEITQIATNYLKLNQID